MTSLPAKPMAAKRNGGTWYTAPRGGKGVWHHHDEIECNLVLRGTARYLLSDRRYDLGSGCLVWLFPHQEHVLVDLSKDFTCWVSIIRPATLRRVAAGPTYRGLREKDPTGHFCRRLAAADLALLNGLCRDVSKQTDDRRFNLGNQNLFLTAWEAFQRAPKLPDSHQLHPAVERAATLIAKNPEADLGDIARQAGLSSSRLSRLFHQQVGQTLVNWRMNMRVKRFLELRSQHPQRTLLSLALTAGFGSYAQFHRAVRRHTGTNPAHL